MKLTSLILTSTRENYDNESLPTQMEIRKTINYLFLQL